MKRSRRGDGAAGLVVDIDGNSGQAKRWVTNFVHIFAVVSWP